MGIGRYLYPGTRLVSSAVIAMAVCSVFDYVKAEHRYFPLDCNSAKFASSTSVLRLQAMLWIIFDIKF